MAFWIIRLIIEGVKNSIAQELLENRDDLVKVEILKTKVTTKALVSRAKKGVHMAIWVFLAFLCIPR